MILIASQEIILGILNQVWRLNMSNKRLIADSWMSHNGWYRIK